MFSPDSSNPQQQAIDEARARIFRAEKDAIYASQELQRRMNPEYVKRRIRHSFKNKISKLDKDLSRNYDHWRLTMLSSLTKNPFPAALVGVGLYLLMKNSSNVKEDWHGGYYRENERWREPEFFGEPGFQNRIKDNLDSAKEKIQEQATELHARGTELKEQAAQKTQQWKEESEQKLQAWKAESEEKMLEMKGVCPKAGPPGQK